MKYITKHYTELTRDELFAIIQLRETVFVVEQKILYVEMEELDRECWHMMGWDGEQLAAYLRIVPFGVKYPDAASLGRIVTAASHRGQRLGRPLMQHGFNQLYERCGDVAIQISAQAHLESFYASVGFVTVSDLYDEEGIPHLAMRKDAP